MSLTLELGKRGRFAKVSFRVHWGIHKYASFHEIRDALNLNFLLCRLNFDFLRVYQTLDA